jgi:hypothetical protein
MSSQSEVASLWYRASDPAAPVAQGDQFWGIELLDAFVGADGKVDVDRVSVDLVVLTQSCNLEHEKVASVLTSPLHRLDEWLQVNPADFSRLEDIRRGYDPSLYLLPAWPDAPVQAARPNRVVDLGQLRVIPFVVLRAALVETTERVALSSPAREHFSQAVARTFMRIGLPADIPSFDLKRLGEETLHLAEIPGDQGPISLVRPLAIARRRHQRIQTGEIFWTMTTRGHSPGLTGAGGNEAQALLSLGSQVVLALRRLAEGDGRWAWLGEYVERQDAEVG